MATNKAANSASYEARLAQKAKAEVEHRLTQEGAPPAWERLPSESERYFSRFQAYLKLGPSRSHAATVAQLAKEGDDMTANVAAILSSRFRWGERVRAYDHWLITQQQAEEEESRAVSGEGPPNWHARERKLRQEKYSLGADIMGLVRERIDEAKGVKRAKDGSLSEIEVVPLKVKDSDWPAFARIATALLNDAVTGGNTGKVVGDSIEDDDDVSKPLVPTNVAVLSDAELKALIPKLENYHARSGSRSTN